MRYFGLLAFLLLIPAAARAQDPDGVRLGLMYQPAYLPGLVVLPFAGTGTAGRMADPVHDIVARDLDYSDRFEIVGGAGSAVSGDSINLPLWKERGADWVLEGVMTPGSGGRAMLRMVLYDAVYGTTKQDQTFVLPAQGDPSFRMAVHAASDEVVRWVTGEPGAAATRIAFVLESRGSKELYIIDYDGEGVQRATNDGGITLSPAWSPDGTRIAYTSYRSGEPYLYERDLQNGRDRLISDRAGINISPTYSPDGGTIAFSTTVGGNTEVATYNRERNCCLEQQTTGRQSDSLSPSYSPDGGQIAFVSNRLGEPHIYVMRVGGGEARLISDYSYGGRSYNTSPDWSPVGQKIAYHTRIGEAMQIIVADLEAGGRRLLTNEGNNEDPSWAPDNRHVVFASRDREGGGLFILDTQSGRVRPSFGVPGTGSPTGPHRCTRRKRRLRIVKFCGPEWPHLGRGTAPTRSRSGGQMKLRLAVVLVVMVVAIGGCARRAPAPPEAGPAPVASSNNNNNNANDAAARARADSIAAAELARRNAEEREERAQMARAQEVLVNVVYFEYDSQELNSDTQDRLRTKAAIMRANPSVEMRVEGHADERGSTEYNIALGQRRAESVRTFLTGYGITANRVSTISYGKERPAVPGATESAYALNRRAEFAVTAGAISAVPPEVR